MKKTLKSEKGITLAILIITVLLLIILTSAVFNEEKDDGTLNRAMNTSKDTDRLINHGKNDVDDIVDEWNNFNIPDQDVLNTI